MKWLCKILGHRWVYSMTASDIAAVGSLVNARRLDRAREVVNETRFYTCRRCGAKR